MASDYLQQMNPYMATFTRQRRKPRTTSIRRLPSSGRTESPLPASPSIVLNNTSFYQYYYISPDSVSTRDPARRNVCATP
ncbi:MAG: hypothetical protein P4M11_00165 [Candidatus Pacebacteria bacterium]|nr:hypothetical protein [Candidatus Paceibacterota bacterium]